MTERRQFYPVATVAVGLSIAFELFAMTTGYAQWPELLLPLGMLCITVEGLIRERHPQAARYLVWGAYPLLTAAIVYASVRTWDLAHHVAG